MAWDDIVVAHVTKHLAANYNAMVAYIKSHKAQHENGGADEISVAGLSGQLADGQTPLAHKTSHQDGGSDEISVTGLSGELTDVQKPKAHVTSHQNGGTDELSVTGLNGTLADPQTPLSHAASHTTGGTDILTLVMTQITGLVAALGGKEPIIATKNTAFNKNYGTTATDVKMNGTQAVGNADLLARIDHVHPNDTSKMSTSPNVTSINGTGIADGEIAVFNETNSDIRTSNKTIITTLGATDDTVSTSKAVKDITDLKAPIASPEFTGDPKSVTPAVDDNDTSIATTAFLQGQKGTSNPSMDGTAAPGTSKKWTPIDHVHPTDTTLAPLASPTFTGDPKAPTPADGDSDTSIATTLFVQNSKVAPHPTLLPITVASKGGVFNGNFELAPSLTAVQTASNWIDGTAAGSATADQYGWWMYRTATAVAASFDSTISHSGKYSLKISTTDVTGNLFVSQDGASSATVVNLSKYCVLLKASTKYRFSYWLKTNNTTNVVGSLRQFDIAAVLGTVISPSTVSGTTDWTQYIVDFTSDADAGGSYAKIVLYNNATGTIGDAWFDDITLEEVIEDTTNTSQIPTPLLSTITGVTSTDNIDQSSTGTLTGAAFVGADSIGDDYINAQGFTPTKNKITGITFYKNANTGTPTGNFRVSIRTDNSNKPSTTIIASYEYTLAAYNALSTGENFVPLPCLLTAGTLYWVVFYDTTANETTNNRFNIGGFATGTYAGGQRAYSTNAETNWTLDGFDHYFKVHYAKSTESATIICNGEKISLSADEDGLLTGAIIDLDKGKYSCNIFGSSTAENTAFANNVYAASIGSYASTPSGINNWLISPFIAAGDGSVDRFITLKVNTMLPIKSLLLTLKYATYSGGVATAEISTDGINFTVIDTVTNTYAAWLSHTVSTSLVNGLTTFYLKFHKSASVNDYFDIGTGKIEADLDTSSLPQPIIYPLATNQFTEEVVLPSTASRVYYQTAKYANNRGIVVPHLEFTDASAVVLKAIPCKIDNTGETNPAINIVIADTLYGQQSGTGSADGATGYILNNGEYMTFSTATQYAKVTYKVGGGTTTFANITKNRIYLSSNGSANSATKDPSHQMGVTLWYRIQSISRTVSDLVGKVSDIAIQMIPSSLWTSWTPTLTWATGAPVTGLVTTARYKLLGNTCFISFNVVSTDSNATTGLTIALPVAPKLNGLYYSLSAIERYGAAGATYANPLAYLADSGTTIGFRAFATATDAQAVEVTVTGWYEI
jgi:hypothetical protein